MKNEDIIEVHVDEIMKEIRRNIQIEEEEKQIPPFESIPVQNRTEVEPDASVSVDWPVLLDSLGYINLNYEVPYYNFLGPQSIKTFVKRVIRKLIRSIVNPIVNNQNILNAHFVRCLNQVRGLAETSKAQEIEQRENKKQIADISDQLQSVEKKNAETSKIQEIEQQEIKKQITDILSQLQSVEKQRQELQDYNQKLEEKIRALEEQQQIGSGEQKKTRRQLQWLEQEGILPKDAEEKVSCQQFLSQSGEDMILAYILGKCGIEESRCTYLDLGANHAKELSNTYHFYQKGARGVLVEANPTLIRELKFYRSGDQIINCCIASEGGQSVAFYVLSNEGLSTPDRAQVDEVMARDSSLKIERTVMIKTATVNEIMNAYFDSAPIYMNIDIEGEEMSILKSIDFEVHRPMIISVEMIPYRTHLVIGEKNQEILRFMRSRDYIEYAFTGINSIFIDKRQIDVMGWDLESVNNLLLTQGKSMNCIPYAKTNEFAQNTGDSVILFPGGTFFGPYLSLPEGHYQLEVAVALNGDKQRLAVTSDNGTQILEEHSLSDGNNTIPLHLQCPCEAVEFVLRNETQKTITLTKMELNTEMGK